MAVWDSCLAAMAKNLNDLRMFDLGSHEWTSLEATSGIPPPVRHSGTMSVLKESEVLLCGGGGEYGMLSDCWVWDIEEKRWEELHHHNFGFRGEHTACFVSDEEGVLIFGGSDDRIDDALNSLGRFSIV